MTQTFQLGPAENERFICSKIDAILKNSVEEFLRTHVLTDLRDTCKLLTDYVKEAVKTQGSIPRHKILVQTFAAQDIGQSMRIGSKSLWDSSTDNYSSYTIKHDQTIFTVLLFALYHE